MIKHIFADYDGTLINSKGHLTATTANAVRASYIPFTLISGRSPFAMHRVINRLNLRAMQVAYNGAVIFKPTVAGQNRIINACLINSLVAVALVQALSYKFPNVAINVADMKRWYTECADDRFKSEQKLMGQPGKIKSMSWVFNQTQLKVTQLTLVTTNPEELTAVKQFIKRLAVPEIAVHQTSRIRIVITNRDVQRSRSINYIMMSEQLYSDEIAGFGADVNDLALLKMVGLPIVTANATDTLKDVAHYVTPTSDDNGIAIALSRVPELQP
jgi:Cof subfamily protein (haloacid dehalogenase superfamily)